MAPLRLRIEGRTFRDTNNREVTLRGINVAGDAKFPTSPNLPSHKFDHFYEGDDVSFVGRPFSVDEAHLHFSRLKRWGYTLIRYIFTWEAIEHAGPGQYDEAWVQHTIQVLRLAKDYGFYVFMDPHQDVWSRFTGGSGAPMWTIYACGLNPRAFPATEAAWVHNTYPNPADYPKMIWATNYTRLACQVIFTMFFAGKAFVPKAIIDGKNIQDYLQDHFVSACRHLALRIQEAGDLENGVVIGWESMNEPNRGLVGFQDISVIPSEQKLQKGPSPTAWQAILLGSGRSCEMAIWDFGGLGPYKSGTTLVDPKGEMAWLPADYDDSKYGWKRDPDWKLGECIWAQHGIWDTSSDELLKKGYFAKDPESGRKIDYEYFTNKWFMSYYRKHREAITSVYSNAIMFCQPPVLEIPPSLKGTEDDDRNMVFSPHYYDGVTLMMKKWNRYWNVDVFGILRGRYLSPAFAIKIGETAIRNCFRDQLSAIRREGVDYMGNHPCVFTEIGIPYDMDDKYAYKTGDYSSQSSAMDANHFALEGCGANGYTLWVYTTMNNHEWGDLWNGEDLSIVSTDDKLLPLSPSANAKGQKSASASSTSSDDRSSPAFSESRSNKNSLASPRNLKQTLSTTSMASLQRSNTPAEIGSNPGYRAAEAYVRPSPIATVGNVISYGFDLRNCTFSLVLESTDVATEEVSTEVFLPEYHFPKDNIAVEVSSGKWTISVDDADGGMIQVLKWQHEKGPQSLTVKGVKKRQGTSLGQEEEAPGYLEQCWQSGCAIM
ncbi:MAG: hypothetical protein L6R38_005572 [Xanthoria sp. 2 TBL-2021]|nr:MAG: hypothetical protein L6R38_005572 [Xanthoria sp. 2 TBL-2021]